MAFEIIEKGTFDGSTAALSLTSIPGTYKHLEWSFMGLTDAPSMHRANIAIKINSDTGSNYGYVGWYHDGVDTVSHNYNQSSTAPFAMGSTGGDNSNANQASTARMWIPNYADTAFHKNFLMDSGCGNIEYPNPGSWGNKFFEVHQCGVWRNTAAITQIDFDFQGGGTVDAGSSYIFAGWTE
jgi:hypothetical protein